MRYGKLGDISDLPPDVVRELSVTRNEADRQIITVIEGLDGIATIDEILVGMYRRFDRVFKRRYLQMKIYRLCKKDLAWPVPKKKGVYTLTEPTT